MFNKIKNKAIEIGVMSTVALMSSPVFATESTAKAAGLAEMAGRGVKAVNAFNQLALGAFYLAGVVVFGMGCYLIYKEQGESGRGHGKKGVVGILVGGALLAMPSMIGITTETVAGKNVESSTCIGSTGTCDSY